MCRDVINFQSALRSKYNRGDGGGTSARSANGGVPRLQGDGAADHQVVACLAVGVAGPGSAPSHPRPGARLHGWLLIPHDVVRWSTGWMQHEIVFCKIVTWPCTAMPGRQTYYKLSNVFCAKFSYWNRILPMKHLIRLWLELFLAINQ